MIPEIKDFETRQFGKNVLLFVTIHDEDDGDNNGEILAEYEITICEYYSDYKITKKTYDEKLTIAETRTLDQYIEQIYESRYFEDEFIKEANEDYGEDSFGWWI